MNMDDGRQAILDRLVAAQAEGRWPATPAAVERSREVVVTAWDEATQRERFLQALERLNVTWELADSAVVARLALATRLQEEEVRRVLAWDARELPIGGVLEALEALGIETVTPALFAPDTRLRPQDIEVRRRQLLDIEAIPVGLVGADAAFAATGTLLLNGGPGRSLLVSQLPRRLLVLLPASRLFPSLERWLAGQPRVPGRLAVPAGVTSLLSGPSRSADIEVTPAYGVHGPSKLHVILIEGR